MLVETSLSIFNLDYLLDHLIGAFFLNFTYLRTLNMAFIAESLYLLVDSYLEEFHHSGSTNLCEQKLLLYSHAAQKVIDDYQAGLGESSMESDTLCELMREKVKKAKYLFLKPATKHQTSFARVLGSLGTAGDEDLADALH